MRKSVTIDGVEYKSRTAAAKILVDGGMELGAVAEKVGMTYQTVYANTKGLEKVKGRRAKYRILKLGKTGKSSAGEISKKVGVTTSKVVSILKAANLTVITAEMKSKAKKDSTKAKATKTPKVSKSVTTPVEPTATSVESPVTTVAA